MDEEASGTVTEGAVQMEGQRQERTHEQLLYWSQRLCRREAAAAWQRSQRHQSFKEQNQEISRAERGGVGRSSACGGRVHASFSCVFVPLRNSPTAMVAQNDAGHRVYHNSLLSPIPMFLLLRNASHWQEDSGLEDHAPWRRNAANAGPSSV